MRLTTKGRYAVTAMLDLAIHQARGPVALTDIASNQDISLSYLEQLFARLRKADLVEGQRGPGGGYRLAKGADLITVAQIVTAVDEKVDATLCGGKEDCLQGGRCLTHDLWTLLSDRLYDFLNDISLAQLIAWPSVKETSARQEAAHPRSVSGVRVDFLETHAGV